MFFEDLSYTTGNSAQRNGAYFPSYISNKRFEYRLLHAQHSKMLLSLQRHIPLLGLCKLQRRLLRGNELRISKHYEKSTQAYMNILRNLIMPQPSSNKVGKSEGRAHLV